MSLQLQAPTVTVNVGDGRLNEHARAISCTIGSSAGNIAEAEIEIQPQGRAAGRLTLLDTSLIDFDQSEVEIEVKDAQNRRQIVHWGQVVAQHTVMDGNDGDRIRLISRIEPYHFGVPLQETQFFNPRTGKAIAVNLPTVFNPDVDGLTTPNMSSRFNANKGYQLFVHTESTRTEAARKYHRAEAGPQVWRLATAVHYLCNTLNGGQAHIENPTIAELTKTLGFFDSEALRNHTCPFGEYLPAQLDALLAPYGFGWCVDFIAKGKRKIRVFRRGDNAPLTLNLQAPGSILDVQKSNVEALNLTTDIAARGFNRVNIFGDYKIRESTFELVRAWSPEYDEADVEKLSRNCVDWDNTPALERVWRDWVLNEAGDYVGVRDSINQPYNFDSLFGPEKWIARRRKFLPCITKHSDGSPYGHAGGVFVEWWDSTESKWKPIDELEALGRQVVILERECGVRFNGMEPPQELMLQGENAKVRVIACVQSDERLNIAMQDSGLVSPLKTQKIEVFDMASRYKNRKRQGGDSPRVLSREKQEADDSAQMRTLGRQLLQQYNVASIAGNVTLFGIHHNTNGLVGRAVAGIDGRRVRFNAKPLVADNKRFPTIMGCRIRFDNQQIDLRLDAEV